MRKSFTLFEIVVVVVLISIVYYFSLSSLNLNSYVKEERITLQNIKKYLLKTPYENEIKISCIKEATECYLFVDGTLNEELIIKDMFKVRPDVFEYTKDLDTIEFGEINLGTFEDFKVDFELRINKYKKSRDFIVDTLGDGVYFFNSFYKEPIKFEYVSEVWDKKMDRIDEVKDAF